MLISPKHVELAIWVCRAMIKFIDLALKVFNQN